MKLTSIKKDHWYETTHGEGKCIRAGGTHPPSVAIDIIKPFPRGILNFNPRDVKREIPCPDQTILRKGT